MEGGCDFQHSSGKAVKIKIVNFVSKPIGFSDIKKFIASTEYPTTCVPQASDSAIGKPKPSEQPKARNMNDSAMRSNTRQRKIDKRLQVNYQLETKLEKKLNQ